MSKPENLTNVESEATESDLVSRYIAKGLYPFFTSPSSIRSKLAEVKNLPESELLNDTLISNLAFRQTWNQHFKNSYPA